ncbi:MAG: DUF3987 domain-containing protein [Scytonematopsis contorta HA4267-MV1]|jgi:hypothetical protein|nr:DUF3987 domain-containing protein [Scytonematopsis contorta HA4267-MV1]
MFAENENYSPLQQRLLGAIAKIPASWSLTPTTGDKKLYQSNWQLFGEKREKISVEIKSGKAKGFALVCGELSGGLLAVDADGDAAHELLQKLGGLPKTVAFSSTKKGRCQYLLRVPQKYWPIFNTLKLDTKVKNENGKPQLLEFRWNGCASVLPPSVHPETGEYKWVVHFIECEIALAPTWLVELILNQEAPQHKYSDIQLPVPERVPLIECTSKLTRSILKNHDVKIGGRNDTAAMLARDLIGTAEYLQRIGQQFDGDPYQILWDWCEKVGLHDDKPKNQFDYIWKSAQNSKQDPSCSDEGVNNCIRGWYWRNYLKSSAYSRARNQSAKTVTSDELLAQIEELVALELPKKHLYVRLNEIAKSTGFPERLIERLTNECRQESQNLELQSSLLESVEKIVSASQHRFDIEDALPKSLALTIKQLASHLNLRPEVYFTALLATVSSLHNAQTRIRLINKTDFELSPNIFAATVAQSSQKKTPVYKAMVTGPLSVLREKIDAEYELQLAEYKEQLLLYESLDKKERAEQFPDGEPQKPPQRLLWFNETTGEGLVAQVQKFPDKGILWAADELASVFKSENAYRSGRGGDEESLLSYYNGDGAVVLRASGPRVNIKNVLLGIFGCIQPDVLGKLMSDCKDPNGKWARFLYVIQPKSGCTLMSDGLSPELTPMLADLYQRIDNLPPQKYLLTPLAKSYFLQVYNVLERKYENTNHPGLSNIYGKAAGYIGKIALNLHVIKYAFNGESVPPLIDLETMKAAVKATSFYLSQALVLYSQFDSQELPYHLSRIIAICQKNADQAWLTAREIAKGFPDKVKLNGKEVKTSCEQIRDWFRQLERLGRGIVSGAGKKLKFSLLNESKPSPVEDIFADIQGKVPIDIRQPESIDITSIEAQVPICRLLGSPSDVVEEIDVSSFEDDQPNENNDCGGSLQSSANGQNLDNEEIAKVPDVEITSTKHQQNRQVDLSNASDDSNNSQERQNINEFKSLMDYLAPEPNFQKGEKCRYVGNNPTLEQEYSNQLLEVTEVKYKKVTCRSDSGYLTTWLDPQDLRKIQD